MVAQVALTRASRFFASEDDGYRLYQAYLLCSGQAEPIGRFWLPGQLAMMCPSMQAGLAPVWAGVLVSTLSLAVLLVALAWLARALAPEDQRDEASAAAALLVLASPMALTLAHSALAELPAAAACALAALGLAQRARGGRRAWIVLGTIAMLVATWTRYECWPLAALYPLAAGWARERRRDAAIAALAWLGPLAWMGLQWRAYGDPLTFVHATAEITAQTGHAGALTVIGHRLWALVIWAPVPLVGALFGRNRAAWMFCAWMALGVLLPAFAGEEHPIFAARLAFALEVGLVPVAALAWSRFRARGALLVALLAIAPLALATARRPTYLDAASVAVGKALRTGRLAPPAGGMLLVDRPVERPPLGWASVASTWAEWPRIVFATRGETAWELVLATDVRHARWRLGDAELGAWLDEAEVTAAWCVTPSCAKTLRVLWPIARVRSIGSGRWITR